MRKDAGHLRKPKPSFLSGKLGVSYTISAVIITVTTITLVVVASNYAYQILEQQRGTSEFEVAKKSILGFDDAVRDVAWDIKGSRSTRFTAKYGQLELLPNDAVHGLYLTVNVTDYPDVSYSNYTGYLKYSISTRYVTYGNEYHSYILGNNETVVSEVTESLGQALVEQQSRWINITLNYRVRAMRTSVVQVGNDTVNYVDILIIRIVVPERLTHIHDFDLVARNVGVTTESWGPYNVDGDNDCNVKVGLDELSTEIEIMLNPGKVVFSFIIAEVQVST